MARIVDVSFSAPVLAPCSRGLPTCWTGLLVGNGMPKSRAAVLRTCESEDRSRLTVERLQLFSRPSRYFEMCLV